MNKKAQSVPRELIILITLGIVLFILIPFINKVIIAGMTGNVNSLVDILIPLIIFAIFFEFIRRLFR